MISPPMQEDRSACCFFVCNIYIYIYLNSAAEAQRRGCPVARLWQGQGEWGGGIKKGKMVLLMDGIEALSPFDVCSLFKDISPFFWGAVRPLAPH